MVREQVLPVATSVNVVTGVTVPKHPVKDAYGGQFAVPSGISQAAQSPTLFGGMVNVEA